MNRFDVRRAALFAAPPVSLCLPKALFGQAAAGPVGTRSVGFPESRQGDSSRAAAKINGKRVAAPIFDPSSRSGNFSKPKGATLFPNNMISTSWGVF